MDCRAVLDSIARLLPVLPEVEDQLVAFDSLVGVSEPGHRAEAAQMLRDAAASGSDPARRERLLKAADAVAAGHPCAFTPDGLSAQQAAASQTVTADAWAGESEGPDEEEGEEEEGEEEEGGEDEERDESDFMAQEPPTLPHLPVRHFFKGLTVRVGRGFTDAQGRALRTGDLLHLLDCEQEKGGGYLLNLLVRTVRLSASHDAIVENAGNTWLQPVPFIECLTELWEAIDLELSDAEEDEAMDAAVERIETLRDDLDACEEWLSRSEGVEAPVCRSGSLAAQIFGRDHHLTYWIRLLFAAVTVALPEV